MVTPIPRISTLATHDRPFHGTVPRIIGRDVPDQTAQIGGQETRRPCGRVAHEDITCPAIDVVAVVRGALGPLAGRGAVEGARGAGEVGELRVGGVGRVPGRVGGRRGGRGLGYDHGHDEGETGSRGKGRSGGGVVRVGAGAAGCLVEGRLLRC